MRPIDADELVHELTEFVRYNDGEYKYGIEAARLVVMDAPTIGGWISVKSGLPKDRQEVLAILVYGGYEILTFEATQKIWWNNEGWLPCDIIDCWMPLPEPPKEECGGDHK